MLLNTFYLSHTKLFIYYYNLLLCCKLIRRISSYNVLSSTDFFLLIPSYFINCSLWILFELPSTPFFFTEDIGENLSTFFNLENFNLSLLPNFFIYFYNDKSFPYYLLLLFTYPFVTFPKLLWDFLSFLSGLSEK